MGAMKEDRENELKQRNVDFTTLSVLDYGDYGIFLARNGAAVGFLDIVPAGAATLWIER